MVQYILVILGMAQKYYKVCTIVLCSFANKSVAEMGSNRIAANNLLISHQDIRGYEREFEDIPSQLSSAKYPGISRVFRVLEEIKLYVSLLRLFFS